MKAILIAVLAGAFLISPSFAVENKAYIKDGKIVIETDDGTKILDYSKTNKYSPYQLKKWDVKEELTAESEALDVYKKRSGTVYQKKAWIISREDTTESIYVEYMTTNGNDQIIFSPDESNAYYLAIDENGSSIVYGLDLSTGDQVVFGPASTFGMLNCDSDLSFIITQHDGGSTARYIYSLDGELDTTLQGALSQEDIQKLICY